MKRRTFITSVSAFLSAPLPSFSKGIFGLGLAKGPPETVVTLTHRETGIVTEYVFENVAGVTGMDPPSPEYDISWEYIDGVRNGPVTLKSVTLTDAESDQ